MPQSHWENRLMPQDFRSEGSPETEADLSLQIKAWSCKWAQLGFVCSNFWAARGGAWPPEIPSVVRGWKSAPSRSNQRPQTMPKTTSRGVSASAWAQAGCLQAQLHILLSLGLCCNVRALGYECNGPDIIYHSQSWCAGGRNIQTTYHGT